MAMVRTGLDLGIARKPIMRRLAGRAGCWVHCPGRATGVRLPIGARLPMHTPSSSSKPSRPRRGRKIWSGTQHVIAYGMPPLGWRDVYHHALEVNWPTFFALLATMFLALNAVFALSLIHI